MFFADVLLLLLLLLPMLLLLLLQGCTGARHRATTRRGT
jgi:hypothetical protein